MLYVQLDADKDFMGQTGKLEPEQIAHCSGAGESLTTLKLLGKCPRSMLYGGLQLD